MKQNPHTIYLACGSGDKTPIMKKVKKFDIQDRFYFTGHIDPHSYGYIIDLYLNTFPFASGEATTEFAIKGHGVLNNKHNNQNILLFFNKDEKNALSFLKDNTNSSYMIKQIELLFNIKYSFD